MWTSIQDRPLAEVLVERDQCLSVRGCCRQDVFIPGISGPVADPLDLMTRGAQDRHRVNQPAAEFEDGSAEPGTSEVRIRFEQPLSHEAAESCDAPGAPGGRAAGVQPDTWEHRSMTWQCRRCGRTVDLVLRDGDRCAACAMRTRAGRTLPADDGAADPPVDGWDVIRIRKLLLQPSSSSAGDAGAQDAIGEATHEAGGDLGDAAS